MKPLLDTLECLVKPAEDMTHLFVIPNTEMGGSKWFDAVSKETFEN
ncbi:hypothetical protein [Neptunitalea lumnitzerae]|nr:hypothetical protein [Neptunitalea sp. Y10]